MAGMAMLERRTVARATVAPMPARMPRMPPTRALEDGVVDDVDATAWSRHDLLVRHHSAR